MTTEDKVHDTFSPLHPLLQREDTRRTNRRRRREGLDCSESNVTLDNSWLDTGVISGLREFNGLSVAEM